VTWTATVYTGVRPMPPSNEPALSEQEPHFDDVL
jgi:hypothetical protein